MKKLTKTEVHAMKAIGMYGDGGNLWLSVRAGSGGAVRKSWLLRYTLPGQKPQSMGLGSYPDVSLADARERAHLARSLLAEGIDPKKHRDEERAKAAACSHTFKQTADAYHKAFSKTWNERHGVNQKSRMQRYVYPKIGDLRVSDIGAAAIMRVLEPIWLTIPVTARRVRGEIESVLDYSSHKGWRDPEKPNPAAWHNLRFSLPATSKVHKERSIPSLPWPQISEFIIELREAGKGIQIQSKETIYRQFMQLLWNSKF